LFTREQFFWFAFRLPPVFCSPRLLITPQRAVFKDMLVIAAQGFGLAVLADSQEHMHQQRPATRRQPASGMSVFRRTSSCTTQSGLRRWAIGTG
jgi:hypothetical protein